MPQQVEPFPMRQLPQGVPLEAAQVVVPVRGQVSAQQFLRPPGTALLECLERQANVCTEPAERFDRADRCAGGSRSLACNAEE